MLCAIGLGSIALMIHGPPPARDQRLTCLRSVSGKKPFVVNADQLGMEVIGIAFVAAISRFTSTDEHELPPTRWRTRVRLLGNRETAAAH